MEYQDRTQDFASADAGIITQPLELGFLVLGLAGSLLVTHRLAQDDADAEAGAHPVRAFIPWAAICLLLWVAAVWLILQPMEMRATFMG